MEGAATGMSAMLGDLYTVCTQVLTLVTDVCAKIVEEPLLLMCTGILLLGGAIGITGRLLSRN